MKRLFSTLRVGILQIHRMKIIDNPTTDQLNKAIIINHAQATNPLWRQTFYQSLNSGKLYCLTEKTLRAMLSTQSGKSLSNSIIQSTKTTITTTTTESFGFLDSKSSSTIAEDKQIDVNQDLMKYNKNASPSLSYLPQVLLTANAVPLSRVIDSVVESKRSEASIIKKPFDKTEFIYALHHTQKQFLADAERGLIQQMAESLEQASKNLALSTQDMVHVRNSQHGATALHIAASHGHIEALTWLINQGADINSRAHNGSTPLHWACSWTNPRPKETVQALLDAGADATLCTYTWESNVFGKDSGQTVLHWAADLAAAQEQAKASTPKATQIQSEKADFNRSIKQSNTPENAAQDAQHSLEQMQPSSMDGMQTGMLSLDDGAARYEFQVVDLLLDHQPDLAAMRDEQGNDASAVAAKRGSKVVEQELARRREEPMYCVVWEVEAVMESMV